MGTQYHLSRFAFLYESTVVGDGTVLNPMGMPDEGKRKNGSRRVLMKSRTGFESDLRSDR